jgi:ABC-2 type transport system permease protein
MNQGRVATLIGKELREFRANPAAILPVVLVVVLCTLVPFVVVLIVPKMTGQSIATDRELQRIIERALDRMPGLAGLTPQAANEAFFFQQFLLLFLIAPIVGAVSLAAYTVVGEKQGRTLEPLLTTPLSTSELLVAKALASFLPSVVIEAGGLCVYFLLVFLLASPGVLASMLSVHTLLMVGLLGPFASLAALQATIAVSSRVNDPRSAQQIAVLLVLPLVMMMVGQIAGAFFLSSEVVVLFALAMAAAWVVLVLLSVALFERETILTRWK